MRCPVCTQSCGHSNPSLYPLCDTCLQAWQRYNRRLGLEEGSALEAICWAARRTKKLQGEAMRLKAAKDLMQELERKRIHMQSREAASPQVQYAESDRRFQEEHGSNPLRSHPHVDPPSDGDAEG